MRKSMKKKYSKNENEKSLEQQIYEFAEALEAFQREYDEGLKEIYKIYGKTYYTDADIFPDIFGDGESIRNAMVKRMRDQFIRRGVLNCKNEK